MANNTIKRIERIGLTITAHYPNDIYGNRDETRVLIHVYAETKKALFQARRHLSRVLRKGVADGRYNAKRGKAIKHHNGTWIDYTQRFEVYNIVK